MPIRSELIRTTAVKPIRVLWAAGLLAVAATVATSQNPVIAPAGDQTFSDTGAVKPTIPANLASPVASSGPTVGAAGEMIGFSHGDGSGTQTITLVHTGKSWMAVYHIDRSGQIRLVSSRPIDADFSLQLNATSPLPEEIRQLGRR